MRPVQVFVTTISVMLMSVSNQTRGAGSGEGEAMDSAASVYALPEVIVTARRLRGPASASPTSVVVLSHSDLLSKPGSLLASSLEGIPGLFVRSYGGGASLRSVSIRGMAPEHTLLLVDGQRVNSYQNGQVDLGVMPLMGIERVEIVKGGFSPLYGADAVGGVVHVFTRKPSSSFSAGARLSLGSYGFRASEVTVSGTVGRLGGRLAFRNEQGDGNYAFLYEDGVTRTMHERLGADYLTNHGEARLNYRVTEHLETSVLLSYGNADRGVPGPVTNVGTFGTARLTDEMVRSQWTVDWTMSTTSRLHVASTLFSAAQKYTDPSIDLAGSSLSSHFVNRYVQVAPEFEFSPLAVLKGTAGGEVVRAWVTGDQLHDTTRWQQSVYGTLQYTVLLPMSVPYELVLYPAIRYDHFSDVEGAVSPKIGLNIGLSRAPVLRLRASYGKSFRAPTFNELYWYAGGNPDLRPERSTSFDCGLFSSARVLGEVSLDLDYFLIDTRDRILWMPSKGMLWTPENIGRVVTEGIELEGRWTGLGGVLSLALNSTWTDARKRSQDAHGDPSDGKRLVYVPQQTLSATMDLHLAGLQLFVRHSWVSHRYSTEMNDRHLPSYAVASAAVRYTVLLERVNVTLKVEGSNLFDESYEIIALYPMPLREVRGSIGVEL
jgi:outer membrane cobalamin receptor